MLTISEVLCYCSSLLSAFMAYKLVRMGPASLTFMNKMFLLFYALDSVTGAVEAYFLFKLQRERWRWRCSLINVYI